MYTRRYSTRSPLTPPPDYSGTSMRQGEEREQTPPPFAISPPPPFTESIPRQAAEQKAEVPARQAAEQKAEAPARQAQRPDLCGEGGVTSPRFTHRRKRGNGVVASAQSRCEQKIPNEKKISNEKKGILSALPSSLATDDLLLLGLILLMLSGDEGSIRDHIDVILLLAFLFFIGLSPITSSLDGKSPK